MFASCITNVLIIIISAPEEFLKSRYANVLIIIIIITRVQLYVNACNWMAVVCCSTIGSSQSTATSEIVKRTGRWSGHRVSCAI